MLEADTTLERLSQGHHSWQADLLEKEGEGTVPTGSSVTTSLPASELGLPGALQPSPSQPEQTCELQTGAPAWKAWLSLL